MRLWLLLGKLFSCYFYVEEGANEVSSILCSDYAIKRIDEPFITADDDKGEWAL